MVIANAAIAFWHHFHPWITKNMDQETVSHSASPNHRKSQNYAQSESQEAPQIHPKIDKTRPPGFSVSIGCPPGPQDHRSPQTWTWKLPPTLAPKIMEKAQNVPKVGPRRLPKCTLKSIKINIWPSVCPLGAALDP